MRMIRNVAKSIWQAAFPPSLFTPANMGHSICTIASMSSSLFIGWLLGEHVPAFIQFFAKSRDAFSVFSHAENCSSELAKSVSASFQFPSSASAMPMWPSEAAVVSCSPRTCILMSAALRWKSVPSRFSPQTFHSFPSASRQAAA